jgi:peptidoglycan/LPS O-acetylase OafA/YrhL
MNLVRRLLWPAEPGAFRLWLALVVVIHHVTRLEIGKAPVLVFFALSGFWVQKVWWGQYAATRASWVTFVVSRWWRIAPLMALSGLVCAAVMIGIGHSEWPLVAGSAFRQVLSGLGVLGYALLPTRPVGPGWSLDVEMQFYLAAPILLAAIRRLSPALALASATVIAEFCLWLGQGVWLGAFLPWFVVGMLAAERDWEVSDGLARGSFVLTWAAFLVALASPWRWTLLGEFGANYAWFNMLLAAMMLPFALAGVRRRGDPADGALADYSYLVYLAHWPAVLVWRGVHWDGPVARWCALLALATLVTFACRAARRWLDTPMHAQRKRWVAQRTASLVKGGDRAALLA